MRRVVIVIILSVFICVTGSAQQRAAVQQRVFNYPLKLQSCHIKIEVNQFIATTFLELEFYNPTGTEVEGYQRFTFNKGQVVSGFQLDLNGKYRGGSIEERWKARNAYNTIVGKRIDPAILQMYSLTDYGLNIYPVPAKGSRKVTITLQELMKEENNRMAYRLPMNFRDTTTNFSVQVKVAQPGLLPYAEAGLLDGKIFNPTDFGSALYFASTGIVLNKNILFHVPLPENNTRFCLSTGNGISRFLLRTQPALPRQNKRELHTLTVFWDVSRSATARDLGKELNYLEKYIALNRISKTEIILFNQRLKGKITYEPALENFDKTRRYLLDYNYQGGTELANLNFASVRSDMILLFSDGASIFGRALPVQGNIQVNSVVSGNMINEKILQQVTMASGGRIINLNQYKDVATSVEPEFATNYLLKVRSLNNNVVINESLPAGYDKLINLSGSVSGDDVLELVYGNNSTGTQVQQVKVSMADRCENNIADKVRMLKAYDSLMTPTQYWNYYYGWHEQLAFGIREKVLTYQTAFLVLDRIEDYIKFNIEPPAELEEACRQQNYVYKSEYRIKVLDEYKKTEGLQRVVNNYNQRIKRWDKDAPFIDLSKPFEIPGANAGNDVASANTMAQQKQSIMLPLQPGGGELKEVVVTGAFNIRRGTRSSTTNVQVINYDRLDVIRQTDLNNALAGKVAGMQVRSQSTVKLGAETLIRLRGENGLGIGRSAPLYVVNGTIVGDVRDIVVDDIEDVTILQGPAAAALFGPEGANGAIVVNYKKARRNYGYSSGWISYNLESAEDVDYLQEIQQTDIAELDGKFLELEKDHRNSPCFYFDMARHFYERNKKREAMDMLITAAEISSYSSKGLRAIAYTLEEWKEYDKAIAIYQQVIAGEYYNAAVNRELALAFFQNRQYQQAVDVLNAVIKRPDRDVEDNTLQKEQALAEMNAFIAASPVVLDLSEVDLRLVKTLPADLRISIGGNESVLSYNNIRITEPDGNQCSIVKPGSANGGYLTATQFTGYRYPANYPGCEAEYVVRRSEDGNYKINIDAYDWWGTPDRVPAYVRVIVFRKFQTAKQSIEVKNIQVDNQYGNVCIAKIAW